MAVLVEGMLLAFLLHQLGDCGVADRPLEIQRGGGRQTAREPGGGLLGACGLRGLDYTLGDPSAAIGICGVSLPVGVHGCLLLCGHAGIES
ncbi:hypothetical protein [Streptomyces longwoodensis]|uniref:hypothetical protein n=1 Tax=Streptomyces longwoodensis TaxID=68231 RepID=UPI0033E0FD60